jgi:4-aminobutyrate aminotransferase-like enzyme
VVARAKDQYVWDADGNQYLDFFGGIVTVSVGHCNEQVNAKVNADGHAAARLHGVRQRTAGGAGEEDRSRLLPAATYEIVLHQ